MSNPSENTPSDQKQWTPHRIVFFALTVAGVAGCFLLIAGFAPALTWAVALAVALHRPYQWVLGRVKKPGLAALAGVLLVLVLLLAPVAVLLQSLGSQVFAVAQMLRSGSAQDWALSTIAKYPWLDKMLDHAVGLVNLKDSSQAAAGYLASKVQALLAGSVRMVTQMAIMLFALFFLFKDGRESRRALLSVLPLTAQRGEFLMTRMEETISASLQGSLTIAAIQGSLGGLMFWALGVPSALLWAFVMGLLAMIPSLGTFLVWMPVAVFLGLSGHAVKAMILFAWGAGVIGTVDNLLYPTLVGKRMRMHTLPTFFSVLGGIAVFGISGLVVGPLILTTTVTLLHFWNPEMLPDAKEQS